jgi:hypothetical protein
MNFGFLGSWLGITFLVFVLFIWFVVNGLVYMLLTMIRIKPLYYLALFFILIYTIYGGYLVSNEKFGLDSYIFTSIINAYYGYYYYLLAI